MYKKIIFKYIAINLLINIYRYRGNCQKQNIEGKNNKPVVFDYIDI
jgi:hypothetical protein